MAPDIRHHRDTASWIAGPLRVMLHPSWLVAFALLFVHLGAVGCLLALSLSLGFKLTIGCAILWSLAYTLCHHAFRCEANSVIEINWTGAGEWDIRRFSGQWQQGFALAFAYVHPLVTVICLQRDRWRNASLVVVSGTLEQSSFRHLRVRLRLEAAQAAAPPSRLSARQRIQK